MGEAGMEPGQDILQLPYQGAEKKDIFSHLPPKSKNRFQNLKDLIAITLFLRKRISRELTYGALMQKRGIKFDYLREICGRYPIGDILSYMSALVDKNGRSMEETYDDNPEHNHIVKFAKLIRKEATK